VSSDSPKPPVRTPQEVIDAAIRENRRWEWLCFALIVLCLAVGIALIVIGVVREQGLLALSGTLFGSLFWPALAHATSIRRENIAVRLLEYPLSQARTEKQSAEAIRDVFSEVFGKGKTDVVPKT
jgi:hypothetical protein